MELITKKEHGCSQQFVDILMKVMGMLPCMPCMPFNGCLYTSTILSPTHSEWIQANLGVFQAEFGRNFRLVGMC